MGKYTENQNVKLSKIQKQSLIKLSAYDVNVSQFIRDAIKEKIQREWPMIKGNKKSFKYPF